MDYSSAPAWWAARASGRGPRAGATRARRPDRGRHADGLRALCTFATVAGVEPTNNSGERALRRAVLWRRRSFGTQSAAGSRFVQRVLTTMSTLRQQQRGVLDYLTTATQAATAGLPIPSLLPPTPADAAIIADPLPRVA